MSEQKDQGYAIVNAQQLMNYIEQTTPTKDQFKLIADTLRKARLFLDRFPEASDDELSSIMADLDELLEKCGLPSGGKN